MLLKHLSQHDPVAHAPATGGSMPFNTSATTPHFGTQSSDWMLHASKQSLHATFAHADWRFHASKSSRCCSKFSRQA